MARADADSSSNSSRPRKRQRVDTDRASAQPSSSSKLQNGDENTPKSTNKSRPQLAKDSTASRLLKTTLQASARVQPQQEQPPQPKGFDGAQDFIAFAPESDNEPPEPPRPQKPQARPGLAVDGRRNSSSSRKRNSEHLDDPDPSSRSRYDAFAPNRSTPWTWGIDWSRSETVAEMLHSEVQAFSDYISPTEEEHETRRLVIRLIENCLCRRWPDARVLPFGSYETRLYHPLGDIDLVIQSNRIDRLNKKVALFQIAHALKDEGLTNNVQVISSAKVPIVKFMTTCGRFAVDISLNQVNGIASGRIINGFLQEIPALRPLAMVIKAFLRQRNMNEVYNGGLGSYSTVCLLVSFLQMHPKVRTGEIRAEKNLGTMLIEFLELYGHLFNTENVGLSLRHGGSYFSKESRGWLDPHKPYMLCIEDPQDPTNDVSKGSFQIRQVFRTFAGANEILTAAACQSAAALDAMRRGRYTTLQREGHSDMGILGKIMAVDNETMNHRQMVKELYDGGQLHDWLGEPKKRQPSLWERKRPQSPTKSPPPLPRASTSQAKRDLAKLREQTTLDYGEEEDMLMSDNDGEGGRAQPNGRHVSDEEEDTRYGSKPTRRGKKAKRAVEPSTFTTDEEDGELHDGLSSPNVVLHTANGGSQSSDEVQIVDGPKRSPEGRIKIDRKREFWAAKSGA